MSNTFSSCFSCDSEIAKFYTWLLKTLFDYGCENEKEKYSFVKPSKKLLKNLSRYASESFAKFIQERSKTREDSQSEYKDRGADQFMSLLSVGMGLDF